MAANNNLLNLSRAFANLKVLVIGEALLDSYLQGTAGRLCREAPVPIVAVAECQDVPGGAANTAANVRSLGGQVTFLSVIGDDGEGERLRHCLEQSGVAGDGCLVAAGRRTLIKNRVVAASQILLRFDQGTTAPIERPVELALQEQLTDLYSQMDAVIISDYGYGVMTPRLIQAITALQRRWPRILLADAKQLSAYRRAGVTAVKPNYGEATQLLGVQPAESGRVEQMMAYERRLLSLTGAQIAAITLDTDGAIIFEAGNPPYRTYARPQPHSRATGAGDTFISALALALAAGGQTPAAAELASAAAALVVNKNGTTACTLEELQGCLAAEEKVVPDLASLATYVALYRQQKRRLVFTNGCFDLIHRGHITYLNQAKALGDVLIVGLNSDESVRRLKGPRRPINSLEDRAQVLSALSCIDHIVPFHEDTPHRLIELIRPDVFVKGGDYTRETLPEAPLVEALGGQVHLLSYLQDVSTTTIIERIRRAYAWPAAGRLPARLAEAGR
jgi:D-beta-D-heptose 7-phosphate kinase/D-beta-D-heptose 1-phosphate adenosyltransferase